MRDKERLDNGLPIRRPRKKLPSKPRHVCRPVHSEARQFLSHVVAHSDALQVSCIDSEDEKDDRLPHRASASAGEMDDVCCLSGVALVPCGHRRFCASCADTVAAMHSGCLLCCTPIQVVLHLFRETTPCLKNVPPLACYNFDTCERILIFLAEILLSSQ